MSLWFIGIHSGSPVSHRLGHFGSPRCFVVRDLQQTFAKAQVDRFFRQTGSNTQTYAGSISAVAAPLTLVVTGDRKTREINRNHPRDVHPFIAFDEEVQRRGGHPVAVARTSFAISM